MKKILLSSFAAVVSFSVVYAQPTLTAPYCNPVAGDLFIGNICDTTGVTSGPSGASVTWNFASLATIDHDTTGYFACLSTPYCDSFTGSDIVSLSAGDYNYYFANTSAFSLMGVHTGSTYMHFSNTLDFIYYPATYSSTHKDTGVIHFAGLGFEDFTTYTDSFNADAWGMLILPSGTFPNTLRVHLIMIVKDSQIVFGTPTVTVSRQDNYFWFDSSFHNPRLTISYDTAGSATSYVSNVEYYNSHLPLSAGTMITNTGNLHVFPNPATNILNLSFALPDTKDVSVSLTDMLGRAVANITSDKMTIGANDLTVPVTDLPEGMYIVRLQTPQGNQTRKVIISK